MSAATMASTSSIRRAPVKGPSVWFGPDMANREAEWTYVLTASDMAEIEAALASVLSRDLDIASIRRADFPLPTPGPVLGRLCDEVLNGRGFLRIRGLPVENLPIRESATAYWGIGAHIGSARSQNARGHLLGHVYDLGGSSAKDPNTRRACRQFSPSLPGR